MDKGSRQNQRSATPHLIVVLALLASVIAAVAYESTAAHASVSAGARIATPRNESAPTSSIVTAADASTNARAGEGVIAITTRMCGNANAWRSVASTNGITPPVYLVMLDQRITVTCASGAQPAPEPPAPTTASGWANPLPGSCVTSGFGPRWGTTHQGVDIGAGTGTPIRAAGDGVVTRSGWIWSGYGISVTIGHGDDWTTHYAHQSRTAVSVGQYVSAGQVIGYVGATGQVTGPHLHFEVANRPGVLGAQLDPVRFMRDRGVALGC